MNTRLLFLLMFLGMGVKAQSVWNKRYIDTRPAMQYGSLLINDSSFYTVGVTTSNAPPYLVKPMWSKISTDGILQQYTALNDSDTNNYGTFFNTLSRDGDSLVKLYGYISDTANLFPILWTIDYSGKVIRAKIYPDSISSLIRGDYMTGDDNGNYYLTASYQYVPGAIDAYVIKVNSQDSILWNKRYGAISPWNESVTSVSLMSNGHIIVGSYKNDQNLPNMKSYTWLFEIDSNGLVTRQWFDHDSTMEARSLKQTADGGFIYTSKRIIAQDIVDVSIRATVVKMDSSLGVEWKWEHPQTMGSVVGGTDIEELSNGDFLVCGKGNLILPNNYLYSAFVMKLSSDGSEKWKKIYTAIDTDGTDNYLNDIDVLPDGSYVAVGYTILPSSIQPTHRQQAWMLKIDSNGCEIENCLVGIDEPQAPQQETIPLKLYPNPATTEITIAVDETMLGSKLTITDITGRQMMSVQLATLNYQLSTDNFASGLYQVFVKRGAQVIAVGKFVKE